MPTLTVVPSASPFRNVDFRNPGALSQIVSVPNLWFRVDSSMRISDDSALEADCDEYATKPINFNELLVKTDAICEKVYAA